MRGLVLGLMEGSGVPYGEVLGTLQGGFWGSEGSFSGVIGRGVGCPIERFLGGVRTPVVALMGVWGAL